MIQTSHLGFGLIILKKRSIEEGQFGLIHSPRFFRGPQKNEAEQKNFRTELGLEEDCSQVGEFMEGDGCFRAGKHAESTSG